MKRIVSLWLVLLMAAALPLPSRAEGQPVNLVMWSLFSGEDGSTMNQIIDDFNNAQSDVHIEHIIFDYSTLITRIALANGDQSAMPHLFVSYASDLEYFGDLGYIRSLQPALDAVDFDLSLERFNDACAIMNMYRGERYAVTLDFPSVGLYANMDLVKQYCPNVFDDEVLTWDEIKAVGAQLKTDGVEDVCVLTSEWAMNDIIQSYMLFNPQWASEDAQTLQLDEEAMVKGINLWKECYDAGYLWEEGDDTLGLFAQGESIFFTGGNWCMNAVRSYGFDFIFRAAPQLDPNNVIMYGDAHSFMVPNRETTDAQWRALGQWMAYFYEHAIDWAGAGSLIAAKDVVESEAFKALPQAFVAAHYAPYVPPFKYTAILQNNVINAFDWQPVYGYISPEDFAKAVVTQTNEQIAAQ